MTAFLLRQNNLWNAATELNTSNAADVKIPRAAFLTPVATPPPGDAQEQSRILVWIGIGGVLLFLIMGLFTLKRSKL